MSHAVSHLKIVPQSAKINATYQRPKQNLGSVLLENNWVTEGDLLKAWSIQRVEQAYIGEILIGLGKITSDQLYQALSTQYNLELVDLTTRPPSTNWADFSDAKKSLKHGYIIWRNTGHNLTIALSNPDQMGKLQNMYQNDAKDVDFVLIKPSDLHNFIVPDQNKSLQNAAINCCPDSMSCRIWAHSEKQYLWVFIIFLLTCASLFAPVTALTFGLSLVFLALIILMGFRIVCLFALVKPVKTPPHRQQVKALIKRPKVSILVPLFQESAILKRLVKRMQAISYPKELLEIYYIFEKDDPHTKAALIELNLPWYMKTIEVPKGQLQTKPRAMNYALDFCAGSIIGIYDAEDAPEIGQIEQVVQKFAHSEDNIACIQCVLDFYNTSTNWMSRCFSIEYAILFRLILPALDRLKLPIPLGGTSVFFRRNVLEELGRWDAYNVTEDADLGYRLYRMGYRCSWINSVTYEEANYRVLPWIKQRSRWLKGFFLTAFVHLRHPVTLHREVGTMAIATMFCFSVIPWIICPLVPIILPMWLLSLGVDLPIYSELPKGFINTLCAIFVATELMSYFLGYKATRVDGKRHLKYWLVSIIFYWPIACLASYKALFEVFYHPSFWDKSEHGINDQLYTSAIRKLTHLPQKKVDL